MTVKTDAGAYLKVMVGLPPLNAAAATRDGAVIDRQGYDSCVLFAQAGVSEGTPTSFTHDAKLQESDASDGTGMTDVAGAAVTQIVAVSTNQKKNVNLRGVKRYIRVREVIAFVGGTSPKLNASAIVVLGGPDVIPAA
jgi:hypothetical protein